MSEKTIPTTRLGAEGPVVGVQGLGCMGMSDFYGESDTAESLATLDRALELGVTLYDTADMYGNGANEELIGPFVRANRDRVVLATKFAIQRDPADPTVRHIRNDAGYIRQAVDASLKRLGVDHIDLYYMHRRNKEVPLSESVGAMAELVQAGKVRWLGLSEVSGAELREAHAIHPITALQSEWSLFSRDVEETAVPAAAELGVAFVPYSPLGRGFLTGAFANANELSASDFRHYQPRFTGDNAAKNAALLEPIREIAAAHGASPAQIALAWVQQRAEVHQLAVVPIPGTRKRTRLEENTAATAITLTPEELAQLEPIASQVAGDRYADMSFVSR
ncbi:aldo/keto reductase [Streptacidiphilus monticola]|uniref:Aldo/keto reductase n=1 Tax=Streptacidiphilus monticola TaxID=2161674 RepID=A0ABW1FV37_9ACTN